MTSTTVTGLSAGQSGTVSEQGNNLVVTVTPEPGTWALFAVGAGVLALAYRRRLQAA